MDWSDTAEQAAFREQVREVIVERLPGRYRTKDEVGSVDEAGGWQADRKSSNPEARSAAQAWADALSEHGWIAPAWPKQYGGAGLSHIEQFIFNAEMAEASAPAVGGMGVSMLGPTLIVHGTEEQRQEHLPRILSGEVAWAQGYSEPGSGSDLASLQTRATRDGDEWVINGQKTWSSGAHFADWMFALVRTDPEAPKHRGISFVIVDLKTPGVSLRPLIDMAWKHPFNETFFEDVRIPSKNLVGEENRGWYVGMTLLDFERSLVALSITYRRGLHDQLEAMRGAASRFVRSDFGTMRLEFVDRAIEAEVLYNFSLRIVSMNARGLVPNYEASVNKMFGSELHQRVARTGTKAWGLYGNVWDPKSPHAPMRATHVQDYVVSVPHTIYSGSNEIQRNVIATRGLGLPRG